MFTVDGVRVVADGLYEFNGGGIGFLRANQPLTPASPYFEVQVISSSNGRPEISIGLSTQSFSGGAMVGQVVDSLGLCNQAPECSLHFGGNKAVPILPSEDMIRRRQTVRVGVVYAGENAKAVYFMRDGSIVARCALLPDESANMLYPVVASPEAAQINVTLQTTPAPEYWSCELNKVRLPSLECAFEQLGQNQDNVIEVHREGIHVVRSTINIDKACSVTVTSIGGRMPTIVGSNGDLFSVGSEVAEINSNATFESLCIKSYDDRRNSETQPHACILHKSGKVSVDRCELFARGSALTQHDNERSRCMIIKSSSLQAISDAKYGIDVGFKRGGSLSMYNVNVREFHCGVRCGADSRVQIQISELYKCTYGMHALHVDFVEVDTCTFIGCVTAGIWHDTDRTKRTRETAVTVRGGTKFEGCLKPLFTRGERSRIYYEKDSVKFVGGNNAGDQIRPFEDGQATPARTPGQPGEDPWDQPSQEETEPVRAAEEASYSAEQVHNKLRTQMAEYTVAEVHRKLLDCGFEAGANATLEDMIDGKTFVTLTGSQLSSYMRLSEVYIHTHTH
jgi:hypothetical protein